MKHFLFISIFGAVQLLNNTFAQGTPWKLPVFTNTTDLAAHASPLAFDKVVLVTDLTGASWFFATNTIVGTNTTTRIASGLSASYSWQLVATATSGSGTGGGNVYTTGTPDVGAVPAYAGTDTTNIAPTTVIIETTTNGSGINMRDTGTGYFGLRAPDTVNTNTMLIGFVYPPPDGATLGVIVDGTNVYLTNMTASGDTLWTNSAGTIQAIQPITGEVDGTTPFLYDSGLSHSMGDLAQWKNNGTLRMELVNNGELALFGSSSHLIDLDVAGPAIQLFVGATPYFRAQTEAGDGITPYLLDSQVTHTSGNLVEIGNNETNKVTISFDGRIMGLALDSPNAGTNNGFGFDTSFADFPVIRYGGADVVLVGSAVTLNYLTGARVVLAETGSNNLVTQENDKFIQWGTGDPEGVVTANVGAIFLRTDGGIGTVLNVKESGSGNTGWAPK